MRRLICFFALILLAACGGKQELETANKALTEPDSFAAPQVTIIADLPDSLKPETVALSTRQKPVRQIIKNKQKPVEAHGGRANFTSFTTDDGLALDIIVCSFKDKTGNLWFGTGGGVSCYDGQRFTTFTTAQGLAKNTVFSIYEDKKGNMWCGTNGDGVSRYDGNSFKTFTTAQGLADNFVFSIAEDKRGNIWFGTMGGGVSRYDGQTFTNFSTTEGLADNYVCSIMEDKTGNIWFGTNGNGVSRYNPGIKSGTDGLFTTFNTEQGLASNSVQNIVEDKTGDIWFGTIGGGVSRYDGQKFTNFTTAQGLANNTVNIIAEDKRGTLWFGTRSGGVSRYNPEPLLGTGGFFTNYSTTEGLANNYIYSIAEDKTGNLWFGTVGGGVSRYEGQAFTSFSATQGLAHNTVLSIAEDKTGNLWFGTIGGGVSRYDPETSLGTGGAITSFTTAQGLANNSVLSIYEDKRGDIWFGTIGGGVSRYDPRAGGSFTTFTTAQGLASNSVHYIVEDKRGNVWFGTSDGVSRYDPETSLGTGGSITSFTTAQGLAINTVYSIAEDKRGNMWFGTIGGGVSRYDGQKFTSFTTAQGLANNTVNSIAEDKRGNIWFATDEGLSVMSVACVQEFSPSLPPQKEGANIAVYFRTFTTADGLPDNIVRQVLQMPDGRIAVGTKLGITLFTPSEDLTKLNDLELFNAKTGYPVKDVNSGQNCLFLDSKGILWAGTGSEKTALVRFDYAALNKDTLPPTVIIKGIKINEETISWNSLENQKSKVKNRKEDSSNVTSAYVTEEVTILGAMLTDVKRDSMVQRFGKVDFDSISPFYYVPQHLALPYSNNHITIDFNAIETGRNFMVNYQYILEGYDDKWSPVTKKGTAVYGNMKEGNYTFKVKAQSPEGVWSEPVIYSFKVLPPWYRTWWMYLIYIITLSGIIYAVFRWRLAALVRDKERLEHTVEERTAEVVAEKKQVEKEKQRSEDLLLNILPAEVAEELKEKGSAEAKLINEVTVLFTDFKGFTQLSEKLSPKELVGEINTCFSAFDSIMHKHGVEKIKTIGDAYMAAGGLPTPNQTHAEDVVKAALEIQAYMHRHREEREAEGNLFFEIRIGVHTGPVVAGIVGIKKFAYDIWGDTVNTASRMESSGTAGKVNISQSTYDLVKDKFTCTYRGEIDAKGKGMLKMYFVD